MNCTVAAQRLFSAEGALDAETKAHLATCQSCAELAAAHEFVDDALSQLREQRPTPPPFDALVPHATAAARTRRLRLLLRRGAPLAIAAGVAAVVTVLVGHAIPPGAPSIVPGDVLSAEAGVRAAQLPDGAQMKLDSGRVTLANAGGNETLVLSSGSVSLRVPKLPAGHSLSVQTQDALVRVHGTRFTVSLTPDGTAVDVTEGLVEVRPTGSGRDAFFLHPGESAHVEPLDAYQTRTRAAAVAALDEGDTGRAERALGLLLATKPQGEVSGEAHALLAWVRRQQGAQEAALDLYRQSLSEVPAGARPSWAEDACAERALLEQQAGGGNGGWRDCLRLFPDGSHAELARLQLGARR